MNRILIIFSLFVCLHTSVSAQSVFDLEWLLNQYRTSRDYLCVQSDSLISENNRKIFKTKVLPTVSLSATLPNFNNNITPVTQPDGQEVFVNRNYANSNLSLYVSQLIPFTGGTVSMSTSIVRLDNFSPNRDVSYNLNLFNVTYNQNLSGYNSYKWEKEQFKAQSELEEIQNIQARENISSVIVSLFFNMYAVQEEYRIQQESMLLAEYLYEKAEILYKNGRISYEELLDAKIEYGRNRIRMSKDDVNEAREQLKSYLDLSDDTEFSVFFDGDTMIPAHYCYNEEEIIDRVSLYSVGLNQKLSEISNTYQLKQIKSADKPSLSLSLGGGMNSQANELAQILNQPNSKMNVSLSISIPILNWSKNKLQYKNQEENMRIMNLNYQSELENLKISCHHDLSMIDDLLNEIEEDNNLIEMLLLKEEIIKKNVDKGRLDFTEISKIRTSLIRANIENVNRIATLYSIIYKYRKMALFDIRTGEYLSMAR